MRIRHSPAPERTTLRKLGIALLALSLVAGAGCTGAVLGGSGGGSGGLIEHVPENQTAVVAFDTAIVDDRTTQQFLAASEEDQASQADLDAAMATVEARTGLDPEGFDSLLVYGQTTGTPSVDAAQSQDDVGILVDTDWATENVTSAIESAGSASLEPREYAESGVFYEVVGESTTEEQDSYLGVHGDGVFVVGTEEMVRSSLDVTYDDGDALSGTLRQAYDDSRDGYVTFATTMPEDANPGTGMAASMTRDVQALTGVYYTDGDSVGVEGRIVMSSADAAEQFSGGVSTLLTTYRNGSAFGPETQRALENLEIGQDGSDVTATYESDVQTLTEAAESQ